MQSHFLPIVFVAALALAPACANAQDEYLIDDSAECDCCDVPGCCCGCVHPPCREVCCPTVERATEKKTCWNVECKKICVPAVRLPWEPGGSPLTLFHCLRDGGDSECRRGSCAGCGADVPCCGTCGACSCSCSCAPVRCGTVRTVHVLEKHSYETPACTTKWEIRRLPPACDDCAATCSP